MKKLRFKIFVIIFSILSIFLVGVFSINSYREYNNKKSKIEDVLIRNNDSFNNLDIKKEDGHNPIFMDYTVYTILLDNNNNYLDVINQSNKDIDEENIKEVVNKILKSSKDKYVSNLIFNKYSYMYNHDSTLTLIDNSTETSEMIKYLSFSFMLFIVLECISYLLSYFLSKWVTNPVYDSFEREKRFIGDASHEIKTPLAVIMASVDAYNNDKDEKWINNIKNESERMSKLVKDLLDLNKLECNKEIEKKNNNLSKIIENFLLTYESLFYENNIKLKYDIKENIMFNCNSDNMKELMSILIDNAIKYNKKNGKVEVFLYKNNKDIILEVKNTGALIKDEDKEKIFDRFYKVDESRNRKNNNYGLGLSIAKRIVELHDGKISASSVDKLTIFKIVWSQK